MIKLKCEMGAGEALAEMFTECRKFGYTRYPIRFYAEDVVSQLISDGCVEMIDEKCMKITEFGAGVSLFGYVGSDILSEYL